MVAASVPWPSLAYRCVTAVSASVIPWPSLLCVCLSCYHKDTRHTGQAPTLLLHDLILTDNLCNDSIIHMPSQSEVLERTQVGTGHSATQHAPHSRVLPTSKNIALLVPSLQIHLPSCTNMARGWVPACLSGGGGGATEWSLPAPSQQAQHQEKGPLVSDAFIKFFLSLKLLITPRIAHQPAGPTNGTFLIFLYPVPIFARASNVLVVV